MILELDCGNSLIKWRVIDDGGMRVGGGVASSDEALVGDLLEIGRLQACRLVSVRSDEETLALVGLLRSQFSIDAARAQPARELAGVRNGYADYARLGLDRWLAVVGAFHLARKACLVIDLGTAITSDFVAADGRHLGGFICPGMPLMRNQLRTHTRRIRYDDQQAEEALQDMSPGRSTVEAVERGCLMMLRGFVREQIVLAEDYCGADFEVFLTGGDVGLVEDMHPQARVDPDLIFTGLAIACPLS
jgi:type III pantothenate kinase